MNTKRGDYPEPACLIHDVSGEDVRGWEMAECTCTRTRVGELTAEVARLRESGRTLGRTIDRWGALIIAATGSQDITDATGDGDWGIIEERLAEVPARMAECGELRARLDAVLALAEPEPDYWDGAQGYELHEVAGRNELARYIREALGVTEEADR